MKVLLHTCCAPCTIYPQRILREAGHQITGFFYRSNIHPYTECRKRWETLETYARQADLPLLAQEEYNVEGFLRQAAFREADRCRFCYHDRLLATAHLARETDQEGFSTTLLYSKYQNHDLIRSIGEAVGRQIDLPFIYQDFRLGWKEGVATSKKMGMYRQQYCGCIYSEKERYLGSSTN